MFSDVFYKIVPFLRKYVKKMAEPDRPQMAEPDRPQMAEADRPQMA
jgi:hypothetical protein